MILVIDNYDSFVHNLARYFRQLGCQTIVKRNDAVDLDWVREHKPEAIVISPGPCSPDQAGCSVEMVKTFCQTIPILGICLGHQSIVQALGGTITLAHEPMHGRQSQISHDGSPMFRQIEPAFDAGRYHSLIANVKDLPACLAITAKTDDGTVMAVEHKTLPVIGLQFHPESVLTESGYQLLSNFLALANIEHTMKELPESRLGTWTSSNSNSSSEPNPRKSSRLSSKSLAASNQSDTPNSIEDLP